MVSTLARWMVIVALAPPSGNAGRPLRIEGAVVCRSVEGFEKYELLPGAALTSDEKLHLYYLPKNYRTVPKGERFAARFTQDARIRAAGSSRVLLRKAGILRYEAVAETPPENVFIQNVVSIKGLPPGDYEYDVILRDENAPKKKQTARTSIKFRVVPPRPPESATPAA